jgi:alanine racemase
MQKTLSKVYLSNIRNNAQKVLSLANNKKLFAVVKANAYGLGAEQVSLAIEDLVYGFCVAIVDEGAQLRIAGITKPILVLTPPLNADDIQKAEMYNLTLTVNSLRTARLCKGISCHIKVNTGMNRYGCNLAELGEIIKELNALQVLGVYSHLYCPNDKDKSYEQLRLFNHAKDIVKDKCPNALCHIAASGGILLGNDFLFDCVRCGLMLYGYTPQGFKKQNLSPALKVYAPLVQVTNIVGGGVGYNVARKKYKRLFTVRAGYADGFERGISLGEKNLCMDAFVAKNGGFSCAIKYNNQIYLPVMTDAEAYAKRCNSIPYEVLCRVTARSLKIYER